MTVQGNIEIKIERKNKNRTIALSFIFLSVFFVPITVKLFNVQVLEHEYYAALAQKQTRKKVTVFAPRGNIYDRNGVTMAENIGENYAFGINSRKVKNKKDLAKRISAITGVKYTEYYQAMKKKNGFVWVERNLTKSQRKQILKCLTIDESYAASFKITPNRIYPLGRNGGQIVGYVDLDGRGVSGIEKIYDSYLEGVDGWEYIFKDAKQNKSFNIDIKRKRPKSGKNVVLTIDKNYQTIVEEELESAVKKWEAKKAIAIVLEPYTGEILAMSSYPNFDPNDPGAIGPFARKNKAVTDIYEPGSTFKALSAAMLLEEGKVKESDVFFCNNKGYKVSDNTKAIRDSHKHENEYLTFRQVIATSSNIGTVKAISRLSQQKFFEYVRSFGIGDRTDIELTGEVRGILRKLRSWTVLTQPNMSFGQGVSVTPLQLAMAYGVIANGGKLMKPTVIKGIADSDNNVIKKSEPLAIRDVISPETALRVRKLLRGVVAGKHGTAPLAEVEGLKVCGKTGTSQKAINGRYSWRYYDASFAGMFPYDDPKLVCTVLVDSPKRMYYGSKVAAPVFRKIVERIYNNHKNTLYASDQEGRKNRMIVPDVSGLSFADAAQKLTENGISFKISNKVPGKVNYQSRTPFSLISKLDTLLISGRIPQTIESSHLDLVPDVKGKSMREGIFQMHKAGVEVTVKGSGNVLRQTLAHGMKKKNTLPVCTLYCEPLIDRKLIVGNSRKGRRKYK